MASKKKREKGAPKGSPLNIKAFAERVVIEGEIYNSVESEIVGTDGQAQPSSFPHLTHKADQRAAHITSSRVVVISGDYVIHERFHQDDDGTNLPVHDRFFAVGNNGVVYTATADWNPEIHIGKKDEKPMRGANINSTVNAKLVFKVGDKPDDKQPPLSPRSQRRSVPDKGYL
jgi:hypothetical protein